MTHLTDETKIKVLQDGLERTITLAELVEYMKDTFTVKRSVYEKDKVKDESSG